MYSAVQLAALGPIASLATLSQNASAAIDSVVQTIPVGAGVAVPSKFLGMHFHYWPTNHTGALSPAPGFGFGTWRSHDYYGDGPDGFRWLNLNPTQQTTTQGIYASAAPYWAELDTVIRTHSLAGRDIYFTIFGTPAWAARNGFRLGPDSVASSAPANNPADLALFVKALVSRYNYAGSTTPIRYLELWNEPNVRGNSVCTFSGSSFTWKFTESNGLNTGLPLVPGDQIFFTSTGSLPTGLATGKVYYVRTVSGAQFTVSATKSGAAITPSLGSGALSCHFLNTFFWGQSGDMAAMAKAAYQAAKAIDPSITVVSPGFTGGLNPKDNQVSSFLNASDGSGGYGRNWCDAIAFHPYDTTVNGTTAAPQLHAVIQAVRSFAAAAGAPASMPFLISEQGWQSTSSVAQSYFLSSADALQANKIVRHALVSAACGMRKHIFYDYDGPYLGSLSVSKSAAKQSMLNWLHTTICGQTIISCEILASGAVRVALANGQVHTV